jgi:hypothetical protein
MMLQEWMYYRERTIQLTMNSGLEKKEYLFVISRSISRNTCGSGGRHLGGITLLGRGYLDLGNRDVS